MSRFGRSGVMSPGLGVMPDRILRNAKMNTFAYSDCFFANRESELRFRYMMYLSVQSDRDRERGFRPSFGLSRITNRLGTLFGCICSAARVEAEGQPTSPARKKNRGAPST
jgi:hypothetical protein